MSDLPPAELGVVGGSGLYALLSGAQEVEVSTPYGPPSDRLVVGAVVAHREHGEAALGPPQERVMVELDGG